MQSVLLAVLFGVGASLPLLLLLRPPTLDAVSSQSVARGAASAAGWTVVAIGDASLSSSSMLTSLRSIVICLLRSEAADGTVVTKFIDCAAGGGGDDAAAVPAPVQFNARPLASGWTARDDDGGGGGVGAMVVGSTLSSPSASSSSSTDLVSSTPT